MTKPKMLEKSQKHNKLATVHFTTYYLSTNCAFTKRQQSIKNYVPSDSKRLSQNNGRKAKKENKAVTVRFTTYHTYKNYTFTNRR